MSRPSPAPAAEASHTRHDVPSDVRFDAMRIKNLADRFAGLMGRHWVADEALDGGADLLIQLARAALEAEARQRAFVKEIRS